MPRRRRGQSASHTSPEFVDAVRALAHICSDDLLAIALNRSGLLTGHGNRWTWERVTALRTHYAIPCYDRNRRESEGWMNLTEAASVLGISARTLRLAVERGEIQQRNTCGCDTGSMPRGRPSLSCTVRRLLHDLVTLLLTRASPRLMFPAAQRRSGSYLTG